MGEQKPLDIGSAILGALEMPVEEDSAPLNLMAGSGLRARSRSDERISVAESSTVLNLRAAAAGLREGSLGPDEYLARLTEIHQHISNILAVFKLSQVQRELARIEEHERALADSTRVGLEAVEAGIARMVQFLESEDPADLDEGLAAVESAFEQLGETQEEALVLVPDDEEDGDEEDQAE